jgi:hypothetical protein
MLPTKWFQRRRILRNQLIRNKNWLWGPHLLMDQDEMSNLNRGPSINASYQVSIHLAKWVQRRRFRNQPIRNKNCLWRPCFLTDQDKMSKIYRGPSIDAYYQVSEDKIKMWKVNRRQTSDGKSSRCLWQGEPKNYLWLFAKMSKF